MYPSHKVRSAQRQPKAPKPGVHLDQGEGYHRPLAQGEGCARAAEGTEAEDIALQSEEALRALALTPSQGARGPEDPRSGVSLHGVKGHKATCEPKEYQVHRAPKAMIREA